MTADGKLWAICRITAGTEGKTDHLDTRVPMADAELDAAYTQNIQIADLNALNAAMAVIKWKKIVGVYDDTDREHHSTYSTNFHLLTSEEQGGMSSARLAPQFVEAIPESLEFWRHLRLHDVCDSRFTSARADAGAKW